MTFELFEAVAAPVPLEDCSDAKCRPTLIVSSASLSRAHEHSVPAMITTAGSDLTSEVVIHDRHEPGLDVPCKVRCKLFTRDDNLIVRKRDPAVCGAETTPLDRLTCQCTMAVVPWSVSWPFKTEPSLVWSK